VGTRVTMKQIQQAGGIVMSQKEQVAIITSKTNRQTFPKGSVEKGETVLEAAQREIYEETGLTNLQLRDELGSIIRPGFTKDNLETPSVMKHIHMFFFVTDETTLKPVETDVLGARWVPLDALEETLSWPEEASFFAQQRAKLHL